jgi:hypothetical protein
MTSDIAPLMTSNRVFLVIWSGGYEAPVMHAFTDLVAAEAKFDEFRRASRDTSDNIVFIEQQVQADLTVVLRTIDEFFPGIDSLDENGFLPAAADVA